MPKLYIPTLLLGILIMTGACGLKSPTGVIPHPLDTPEQGTESPNSGIFGQALLGPTCPGPVQLEATECADQPYQGKINILDEKGLLVQQYETDTDGHFRISLEPGTYILHPESKDRYPFADDQTVDVLANQFTEVIILFDTGIR